MNQSPEYMFQRFLAWIMGIDTDPNNVKTYGFHYIPIMKIANIIICVFFFFMSLTFFNNFFLTEDRIILSLFLTIFFTLVIYFINVIFIQIFNNIAVIARNSDISTLPRKRKTPSK